VAPNVGHNVKIVNYQSENVATDPNISPNNFSVEKNFFLIIVTISSTKTG
jgi:hypothetical protein